jgi:hypothetical protein
VKLQTISKNALLPRGTTRIVVACPMDRRGARAAERLIFNPLRRSHRRYADPLRSPGRATGHDLDNARGEANKCANLPGAIVGACQVHNHAAAPGTK